ncbi:MAG: hypothetical protein ABJE66_31145 [Deltaproteobacteria bacterium]
MSSLARIVVAVIAVSSVGYADSKVQISTRIKTVEIRDDAWGITAFRIEIPADWTFEGVLLRDPYCGGVPTVAYRISSPDGLSGFQALPSFVWHWSDDASNLKIYRQAHCKTMEAMSPTDFLSYVAPSIRPNPTLGPIQPTVDAAQIDQMIAQFNDQARRARMTMEESGGGVHSRIEYTFRGHTIEENLRVVVQTTKTQINMGRGPVRYAWNSFADVSGVRAPKGQLDAVAKAIGPLIAKGAYTQDWLNRQHRKMAKDQEIAMAQIKKTGDETSAMLKKSHEAYMKQSKASFEKSQKADRDRMEAQHAGAVAWTLYAGDEQLVRNPKTHEVSRVTSTAGKNAHQDEVSGNIVITDDPNYDPSYYIRGTWTQLENVSP